MQNTENNAAPKIARAMHRAGIAENINRASGVLTDNSKVVLERRYLTKDATGKTTEDPEGMFRRVARNLSQADLNYNNTQEEEETADRGRVL